MKRRTFVKSLGAFSVVLSASGTNANPALTLSEFRQRMGSRAGDDSALWEIVREQFLFPEGYAYFNTGGIGAVPAIVLNRVKDHMNRSQVHPRPGHDHDLWEAVKRKCAELFGSACHEDELALTGNASTLTLASSYITPSFISWAFTRHP